MAVALGFDRETITCHVAKWISESQKLHRGYRQRGLEGIMALWKPGGLGRGKVKEKEKETP